MKILLHVCCAPCAIPPVRILRDEEGADLICYFSNFNIHPLSEFISRLESFQKLTKAWGLSAVTDTEYGLHRFLGSIGGERESPARCARCYGVRMHGAAGKARELGCDAFTTTLLVSPHQPQELIREAGVAAAQEHSVEFAERDFRSAFGDIRPAAQELGLYMQKYCGCIYSEQARFEKRLRKLAQGSR